MNQLVIPVKTEEKTLLPEYGSELAAGADVRAAIPEELILLPGERLLVPTGLFFEIPPGYEIQVRPRSGLAFKNGITVLNTPGTIDADYRGELKVLLINHGKEPFSITPKMRIAQIVVAPALRVSFLEIGELAASVRGDKGFGHTGTH